MSPKTKLAKRFAASQRFLVPSSAIDFFRLPKDDRTSLVGKKTIAN
jgi:hypothetical protein